MKSMYQIGANAPDTKEQQNSQIRSHGFLCRLTDPSVSSMVKLSPRAKPGFPPRNTRKPPMADTEEHGRRSRMSFHRTRASSRFVSLTVGLNQEDILRRRRWPKTSPIRP